jgi:hypothetical protein
MESPERWFAVVVVVLVSSPAFAGEVGLQAEPMKLQMEPASILNAVATQLDVEIRPQIPLPAIRLESVTPLKQFQDVTEQQWGFRPARFVNVFVAHSNEIYLIDDVAYYSASGGSLDEALAHELVHYIQARYGRANLHDWAECEAVAIQRWFRETHMRTVTDRVATLER